jgi:hypothetical protein
VVDVVDLDEDGVVLECRRVLWVEDALACLRGDVRREDDLVLGFGEDRLQRGAEAVVEGDMALLCADEVN